MTHSESRTIPSDSNLQEEAVTWVVRLTSGQCSPSMLADYRAWLGSSPAHAEALKEARQLWLALETPLENSVAAKPAGSKSPKPRLYQAVLAAAACLLLAVGMAMFVGQQHDFKTSSGQLQTATLSDGTHVQLSPQTSLDVEFNSQQRHVDLVSGEAYFDVSHNPSRPFIVDAGYGRIRVIGTAFSVRRYDNRVAITVVCGRVEVSGGSLRHSLFLTANQRVSFSPTDSQSPISVVDTNQVLAWRFGKLQFEDTPLDRVLDELQRYDRRYWVYSRDVMSRISVSASVNVNSIDEWLATLRRSMPVKVAELGPLVLVRADPQAVDAGLEHTDVKSTLNPSIEEI